MPRLLSLPVAGMIEDYLSMVSGKVLTEALSFKPEDGTTFRIPRTKRSYHK